MMLMADIGLWHLAMHTRGSMGISLTQVPGNDLLANGAMCSSSGRSNLPSGTQVATGYKFAATARLAFAGTRPEGATLDSG